MRVWVSKVDKRSLVVDSANAAQDLSKEMDALMSAINDKEPAARNEDYGKDLPSVLVRGDDPFSRWVGGD